MIADERMQKWRTDRIAEYARLEKDIALEMHYLEIDPDLVKLMKEQAKLNDMVALTKGIYTKNIEAAQQQQTGIKAELVETWGDTEDKTFTCDAGMVTLRITKSLQIKSKAKLVNFLATLNKLPDFIKTFEITKLRKIKDAGLLDNETASYDEKKSISIKLVEAEQ